MQQQSQGRRPLLVLLLVVLALALCCCRADGAGAGVWRHAVIVDAGSTGSRAHVFRYQPHAPRGAAGLGHSPYPQVDLPEAVLKTTPGLSAFASNPAAAAQSLQPLIEFAKGKVPQEQWPYTPIQLMATAGVRLLRNGSAEQIMREVSRFLSGCGFDFVGARVLTGTEEGLLGWVALNYASGALQAASLTDKQPNYLGRKDPPSRSDINNSSKVPLLGVLELGGGSLQVTFLPSSPPPLAEASPLALPSLGSGRLYSRSFDGLGLQAALAKWKSGLAARQQSHDPCLHVGFTASATSTNSSSGSSSTSLRGSGNWHACKAGVVSLLPKDKPCLYKLCGLAGSFLPPVEGATFVGVDNFFYTASTLGLPTSRGTSLDELDKAAATFCGSSWSHIRSHYLKNHQGDPTDSYHAKVCFSAALILGLLAQGLHLPTTTPLLVASNSITTPQGEALEAKWPLGALVVGLLHSRGAGLKGPFSLNPKASGARKTLTPKHHRTHDHPMLGAAGGEAEAGGLTPGSAAVVAGLFCLSCLAMTLALSWIGVGLPGHGRVGMLWHRLHWALGRPLLGPRRPTTSGGAGPGVSGGSGGEGSWDSVRYLRVRPQSRGARSRSGSPARRGEDSSATAGRTVAGSSVMLAVLPVSTSAVVNGAAPVAAAEGVSSGAGQPAIWPLTARQR